MHSEKSKHGRYEQVLRQDLNRVVKSICKVDNGIFKQRDPMAALDPVQY